MRTEASRAPASAATRLRHHVGRARTWMRGLGRATRLALVAAAVAGLVAAAFLAIPTDRDEMLWLYEGRKFAGDDAREIQKALAAEKVPFQADPGHRIGVATSRWGDAMAALEKHDVGPASLAAIEKDRPASDPWSDRDAKAEQDRWLLERWLKANIEKYPGTIRSASVRIRRTPVRAGLRPEVKVGVLVILDVEHRPSHKAIRAIQTLLTNAVPGLAPEAVTIGDQSGNFFLDASNPNAASETQILARAEVLRDALIEKLGPLIPSVDVDVMLEPHGSAPSPAPIPRPPAPPAEPEGGARPNVPVGLEPDPEPMPSHPAPAVAAQAPGAGKANVWVKVPRSYYLRVAARENAPGRQPSADDLKFYAQRTRELIGDAVAVLIPPAETGRVMVDTIQDNLAVEPPPAVPPGAADSARSWPHWLAPAALGAGVGLGVALVLGTGFGLIASRRPSARPSRAGVRSGLSVDAPSGPVPGPSERVRDLVRRDPEAAAGVLQRWIGQGEGGPNP